MNILIIEDHPLFAQSLSQFCLEKGNTVSWAKSLPEFNEAMASNTFHLAFVDLILKDELSGFDICRELKTNFPETKIIILSTFDQDHLLVQAQQLKVDAYLIKTAKLTEVESAMAAVMEGKRYFSQELKDSLERKASFFKRNSLKIPQVQKLKLTPKENEVLRLIVEQEHNDKAIASTMGISAHTVRDHKKHIYDKLNVHDVVDLIKFYYKEIKN